MFPLSHHHQWCPQKLSWMRQPTSPWWLQASEKTSHLASGWGCSRWSGHNWWVTYIPLSNSPNPCQNCVRAVIADVPCGLSIPPMLMSLNHDLPYPSIPFTEWPNWPQLLQATMENVVNHLWCNQAEDLPPPREELVDDEHNTIRTDIKGKGKAREVSDDEDLAGEDETRGRCGVSQHAQSRGCSQSHRPCKHVKSVATVDADEDDHPKPSPHVSTRSYDLLDPPSDLDRVPITNQCYQCTHHNLPCSREPRHACWQCKMTRHGCTFAQEVHTMSWSWSYALQGQSNPPCATPPPPPSGPIPICSNPPWRGRKHKDRSPIQAPPSTPGPSKPGSSRGKWESEFSFYFFLLHWGP